MQQLHPDAVRLVLFDLPGAKELLSSTPDFLCVRAVDHVAADATGSMQSTRYIHMLNLPVLRTVAPASFTGLLFFTTYTLLVLFWAEIYHQARSMPTGSLRPIFIAFNALVYACQVRATASS